MFDPIIIVFETGLLGVLALISLIFTAVWAVQGIKNERKRTLLFNKIEDKFEKEKKGAENE